MPAVKKISRGAILDAAVEVLRDGCVESVHVDMHDHALAHAAPPHCVGTYVR